MSDQGDKMCPLCAEEMDLTDQQLKPCKCGYEVCRCSLSPTFLESSYWIFFDNGGVWVNLHALRLFHGYLQLPHQHRYRVTFLTQA